MTAAAASRSGRVRVMGGAGCALRRGSLMWRCRRCGADAPFRSLLMSFLEGNSEVLDALVNEMYARGLSTRDVEDAFTDATGELLISKSAVSEITDRLWEDYQAFISRDLSDLEVEYLFVDAVFESLRRHGAKDALLVGW